MRTIACILLSAALMVSSCDRNLARSNPNDPLYDGNGGATASIEGTYYASGMPVVGANVYTSPSIQTVQTDGAGKYKLTGIPAGTYSVFGQVPWMAGTSSPQQKITAGSLTTVNLTSVSLAPNYQSPCSPEGFETYTPAVIPPTPWAATQSGGTVAVDNAIMSSGTRSCKLTSGSSTGNNSKIELFGLGAFKGVRVTAKVRVEDLLSNFKIGVSDLNGKTTELAVLGSASNKVRYTLPTTVTGDPTLTSAIAIGMWYTLYFELDYEAKTAKFEVWDQNKSSKYTDTGALTFAGSFGTIDRFYIVNTNYTPTMSVVGYVDEITIIKK